MTSEYQKMIAGEFYSPSDPELRALAQLGKIYMSIHAWWSIMESISI